MTKMYSRTHHDDPLMLAPGTRHGFPVPNAFKKKKKVKFDRVILHVARIS